MAGLEYQWQKILHHLMDEVRKTGTNDRMGTVHQVMSANGIQKIKVVLGTDPNGQPWLSPWLHTEDHRGPHRQQEKYHVGMNVKVSGVAGDFRQATVTPWAENDKHVAPDNANDYDHTYQHDAVLERKGTDFHRFTLADKGSQQSGTQSSGTGSSSQQQKLSEDKFKVRVTSGSPPQRQQQQQAWDGPPGNDGKPQGVYTIEATDSVTITVGGQQSGSNSNSAERTSSGSGGTTIAVTPNQVQITYGQATFTLNGTMVRGEFNDARFVADSSVAKIRKGNSWVVVDGTQVIVSSNPVVGADPDSN